MMDVSNWTVEEFNMMFTLLGGDWKVKRSGSVVIVAPDFPSQATYEW